MFKKILDVYSKSIEKRVGNQEEAKEFINMIKDIQSKINAHNIKYDSNGKPIYESLFRRDGPFVDSSGKFKYDPNKEYI